MDGGIHNMKLGVCYSQCLLLMDASKETRIIILRKEYQNKILPVCLSSVFDKLSDCQI